VTFDYLMNKMIPIATRNFTALISFDSKNEEITGRGITTSVDAKLCFDMLKFVLTEYQRDVLQCNAVVPLNKKMFWRGLRTYCQTRFQDDMTNWGRVFWAGYPLYQIPISSHEDNFYLFRMNTMIVNLETANNTCTLTHKQLHDMLNKQYRKSGGQGTRTGSPPVSIAGPKSALQFQSCSCEMLRRPVPSLTNIRYSNFDAERKVQSNRTLPVLSRIASSLTSNTVTGINVSEPCLLDRTRRQIEGSPVMLETSQNGASLPTCSLGTIVKMSNRLGAERELPNNPRHNVETSENSNEILNDVVALLTKVLDENVIQLSENEADWVQRELRSSLIKVNLKRRAVSECNRAEELPKKPTQ